MGVRLATPDSAWTNYILITATGSNAGTPAISGHFVFSAVEDKTNELQMLSDDIARTSFS